MRTKTDTYLQFRMSSEYKAKLQQASQDFDMPISELVFEGVAHRVVERYSSMASILYKLALKEEQAGNHEKAQIRKELFGEMMEKAYSFANDNETLKRYSEWIDGMEAEAQNELQHA